METLLENDPRDVKVLHELGRLYHQYEQSDKAVEIYNRITEIDPTDLEAVKLGKDASARASMKTGGWNEAESYRDLIKDKEIAVSLEQQSRMQLTGESLEQQINETFARHEAEPQNVDLAKRLGALHDQKDDLDGAIAWYQYAVDLTNRSDPGLGPESCRPEDATARAADSRRRSTISRSTAAATNSSRRKRPSSRRRKGSAPRS